MKLTCKMPQIHQSKDVSINRIFLVFIANQYELISNFEFS